MWLHYTLEVISVLIMAGGIFGIFYGIVKHNVSMGVRTIQFLAVVFVLPVILILGLEQAMGRDAIAALIGTIVGYALSGISKSE